MSVIELGYAQGLTNQEWVAQLCEATHRSFGLGTGTFGYLYDAGGDALIVDAPYSTNAPRAFRGLVTGTMPALDQQVSRAVRGELYTPYPRIDLASRQAQFDSQSVSAMWELMRPLLGEGAADVLGLRAGGLDRRGLLLCFPVLAPELPALATRRRLDRVAAHLAAAFRLRDQAATLEDASAVLDPQGRLQHARDADLIGRRGALAAAVERMRHARGRETRLDPDASVNAWRALVDGHWSVIDHTDVDGKRFIVARRNEPLDRSRNAIHDTSRQVLELTAAGYSNKLVAYELGISPAAVTSHLHRGLKRLGLRTRQELIALRCADGDWGSRA